MSIRNFDCSGKGPHPANRLDPPHFDVAPPFRAAHAGLKPGATKPKCVTTDSPGSGKVPIATVSFTEKSQGAGRRHYQGTGVLPGSVGGFLTVEQCAASGTPHLRRGVMTSGLHPWQHPSLETVISRCVRWIKPEKLRPAAAGNTPDSTPAGLESA